MGPARTAHPPGNWTFLCRWGRRLRDQLPQTANTMERPLGALRILSPSKLYWKSTSLPSAPNASSPMPPQSSELHPNRPSRHWAPHTSFLKTQLVCVQQHSNSHKRREVPSLPHTQVKKQHTSSLSAWHYKPQVCARVLVLVTVMPAKPS